MKYRVLWSPYAEARLDSLFENNYSRELIASTVKEIERALRIDPLGFGESRYDTVRVGFIRPIAVLYDLMQDVRTVGVYDVWRIDADRVK